MLVVVLLEMDIKKLTTLIEALTFKLLRVRAEESAESKLRKSSWYILDEHTQRRAESIDLLVQSGII